MKTKTFSINNNYSVTFETKCYENDWEFLLKTNYLDNMINNCNYNFEKKQLIINNITNKNLIEKYAKRKLKKGIIDAYYFVDDYINIVLKHFSLTKNSFGKGYYYSTAELTGIYVSNTEFLFHFSSDAFFHTKDKSNWINGACEILAADNSYLLANPAWNKNLDSIKNDSAGNEAGDFFICSGFSDQCYLIRPKDFKNNIYTFSHPDSERYPEYGGELFEKKVDSYMLVHNKKRLVSKYKYYIHFNFPSNNKLFFLLCVNNLFFYYYIRRFFRKINYLFELACKK